MREDIVKRLQFWKHNSEAYAPHPTWRFHTDLDEACAEIERLRIAVSWALGESPEGVPEFEPRNEGEPAYWWRKQLRALTGITHVQEGYKGEKE